MDGFDRMPWYHKLWFYPLFLAAAGVQGAYERLRRGPGCAVKACGMRAVRDGLCQGHYDGIQEKEV